METSTLGLAAGSCDLSYVTDQSLRSAVVVPAQARVGGTWEALSHLGPTMLKTCLCVIAEVKDLLVASAGPLSLASFDCRLRGREEKGEPPQ